MYMPNPNDVLQAMDAVTGDLLWEYRRPIPDDVDEYIRGLVSVNRNVAIYGNLVIDTGNDDYAYAVDAATGRLAWRRRSSTTGRTPPGTPQARSSPTARSSPGAVAGRGPAPRRA